MSRLTCNCHTNHGHPVTELLQAWSESRGRTQKDSVPGQQATLAVVPACLPVVTVIAAVGLRVTGTCRASRLSSPPRMSPGPGRATIESLTRNQTLMSVYRRAASGLKNRHWQLQNQSGEVCLRSSSRLAALSVFVMAGRADFPPPQNFGPRSGPLAKKSNVVGCCGVFRIWK